MVFYESFGGIMMLKQDIKQRIIESLVPNVNLYKVGSRSILTVYFYN